MRFNFSVSYQRTLHDDGTEDIDLDAIGISTLPQNIQDEMIDHIKKELVKYADNADREVFIPRIQTKVKIVPTENMKNISLSYAVDKTTKNVEPEITQEMEKYIKRMLDVKCINKSTT